MASAAENVAIATAFVAAPTARVWQIVADIAEWDHLFPGWTAAVAADDDRFTATGPNGEKFDLYPHDDEERHTLDVETVDELGSADTLRLRVLATHGGCFVVVSHARLNGTPDAQWNAKREAIAAGVESIGSLL